MAEPPEKLDEMSKWADAWCLDPAVDFLNHGSFGACPKVVLAAQQEFRRQMELEPVRFLARQLEPLLDESRRVLAELVAADPSDMVFVRNATAGVNGVLRSLKFNSGDELLVTDHAYNACRNVVDFVADRAGIKVVTVSVPLPIGSDDEIVDRLLACVSDRTRLALLDHVASPTAVVFPIERLVAELDRCGVDALVDGAHVPGMLPLDLDRIGAAYYVGNCHKWLCTPKGTGFLHVRSDKQSGVEPTVISHGYNTPRRGRNRLHTAFDWTGTDDPTGWLCLPEAIRFLSSLSPDGLAGLMRRNHRLAVAARRTILDALSLKPPCPEEMIGSMAAVCLPDDNSIAAAGQLHDVHPLQTRLFEQHGIEVPVFHWPSPPQLMLRISAAAYNRSEQYQRLADVLGDLLRPV